MDVLNLPFDNETSTIFLKLHCRVDNKKHTSGLSRAFNYL